jgi:hypothetical protein
MRYRAYDCERVFVEALAIVRKRGNVRVTMVLGQVDDDSYSDLTVKVTGYDGAKAFSGTRAEDEAIAWVRALYGKDEAAA